MDLIKTIPGFIKFFSFFSDEDLPSFPVDSKVMQVIKNRVRLAREVEEMDLQTRRYTDEMNWRKKAADDIGVILEDQDDS